MKTFKLNTTQDSINKGKRVIKDNGGSVYTDGTFEVSGVEGSFNFNGGVLSVTITDKPFLASRGLIESKLESFFS